MCKTLFACLMIVAGQVASSATVCPATTFDKYLGKGYSCNIDVDQFSGFSYSGSSNPPGRGVVAAAIKVTPLTTKMRPGFEFSAAWSVSSTGIMSQESLFAYTINVNKGGAPTTDLELSVANVAFTGTGTVDGQGIRLHRRVATGLHRREARTIGGLRRRQSY